VTILYGATVSDVVGLLPHLTISNTSRPSTDQVTQYLDMACQWVAMRLGDTSSFSAAEQALITNHAKGVAELRAAAHAQTAAFPELAGDKDQLGASLMAQSEDALNEALEAMGEGVGGVGGAVPTGPPTQPAAYFPPPKITDQIQF
jgi:hypothetical protein